MLKLKSNSIVTRFLLLILIPVIILQSITVCVFYQRHWKSLTKTLVESLGGEIEVITKTLSLYLYQEYLHEDFQINLKRNYEETLKNQSSIAQALNIEISISKIENDIFIQEYENINDKDEILKIISIELSNRSLNLLKIYRKERNIHCALQVAVEIPTLQNYIIDLSFSDKRVQSPTTHIFVWWVIGSAVTMMIISIVVMRGQLKSILAVTDIAGKLGRGEELGSFIPSGALEIRSTGKALIQMNKRIDNYVSTRMEMLTHISHDIRTPLTRMKLILSLTPKSEIHSGLNRNLKEIEKLLASYLQFAKGEGNEKMVRVDILDLIYKVREKYDNTTIIVRNKINDNTVKSNINKKFFNKKQNNKQKFSSIKYYCMLRPLAIERALTNLLNNAIKFAQSAIIITIKKQVIDHDYIIISVEDDGPGIANPDQAILPFFTQESIIRTEKISKTSYKYNSNNAKDSYNNNKISSNYGLGLSIVNTITTAHGGKLIIKKSKELNGAKIILIIPIT